MAQHDLNTPAPPSTALAIVLTGWGALLFIVAIIAVLVMNPPNWFGIGLAAFAGLYSIIMARVVTRRRLTRA